MTTAAKPSVAGSKQLSTVSQDYLKLLWKAEEHGSREPLRIKWLAGKLGVSASTVSETVSRLTDEGYIDHTPYGSLALTDSGRAVAAGVVRRHRLMETFLHSRLGYRWDEVHAEAESLEHVVSDLLMARIDAELGHPTRDPHGDPIPSPDGAVPALGGVRLTDLAQGDDGVVVRVSDGDSAMLRYFDELGIGLGVRVRVLELREFAGTVCVRLQGGGDTFEPGVRPRTETPEVSPDNLDIGYVAAQSIWVDKTNSGSEVRVGMDARKGNR